MPRKKTPTNTNSPSAAINLEDDETLVEKVTTVKEIGRQKRKPEPEADDGAIIGEPVIDEDDETDDDQEPEYGADSIAAALFGSGSDDYENEYCTVKVRRNPDSIGDH